MFVGYMSVTTNQDTLARQKHVLRQAGCERLILDEATGVGNTQPGLQKAMVWLRPGDTLVVWRLSRLGRSLQDVAQKLEEFGRRGIGVRSLCEDIDTSGEQGHIQLRLISALAEFERELKREQIITGVRRAQAQGRRFGRQRAMTPENVKLASQLRKDSSILVKEICRRLGVSKATLYRYVGPKGEIREP